MTKIRHIFFDLGGVLVKFDASKIYQGLAGFSPHTAQEFYEIASNAHHGLARDFELGLITGETFYENITQKFDLKINIEMFKQIYVDIFQENLAMIDLAKRLKQHYAIHMISNTTVWHFDYVCASYSWMKLFEQIITSFDVHVLKPAPGIFLHALKQTQALASESVFIDDYPENVVAARALGINAIHYLEDHALLRQLKFLNVTC